MSARVCTSSLLLALLALMALIECGQAEKTVLFKQQGLRDETCPEIGKILHIVQVLSTKSFVPYTATAHSLICDETPSALTAAGCRRDCPRHTDPCFQMEAGACYCCYAEE